MEDESVFENISDNPMISSDDILIYIDGQDHLKVVARNENAASLEGIFICEGISTLIEQFYADQQLFVDLIYELIRNTSMQ